MKFILYICSFYSFFVVYLNKYNLTEYDFAGEIPIKNWEKTFILFFYFIAG